MSKEKDPLSFSTDDDGCIVISHDGGDIKLLPFDESYRDNPQYYEHQLGFQPIGAKRWIHPFNYWYGKKTNGTRMEGSPSFWRRFIGRLWYKEIWSRNPHDIYNNYYTQDIYRK